MQRSETVLSSTSERKVAPTELDAAGRELNVYSEIVPYRLTAARDHRRPPAATDPFRCPKSVHVRGCAVARPAIYDLGIPIFGICYGTQLIAQQLGAKSARYAGEYGRAKLEVADGPRTAPRPAVDARRCDSHFDAVTRYGWFIALASTRCARGALESASRRILGCASSIPRSCTRPHGMIVLQRFLHDLAGCAPTWTMARSSIPRSQQCVPRSATRVRSVA